MKTTLTLVSLLMSASAFADSSVFCQAKTAKGARVTTSFCAVEKGQFTNTFVPCGGEGVPLVTVAYFAANPEGLDVDPIVLQLPAENFDMSIDEDTLSMTTNESSTIGTFTLSNAHNSVTGSSKNWYLDVHGPEDQKGKAKIKGNFKKFTCSWQEDGE